MSFLCFDASMKCHFSLLSFYVTSYTVCLLVLTLSTSVDCWYSLLASWTQIRQKYNPAFCAAQFGSSLFAYDHKLIIGLILVNCHLLLTLRKHVWPRSVLTFSQAWSGSKLFALWWYRPRVLWHLVCLWPTKRKLCSCWLTLCLLYLCCLLIIFAKRMNPDVWPDLNPICLTL